MLKECKKKLIVMWTPFLRTGIFVINLVFLVKFHAIICMISTDMVSINVILYQAFISFSVTIIVFPSKAEKSHVFMQCKCYFIACK